MTQNTIKSLLTGLSKEKILIGAAVAAGAGIIGATISVLKSKKAEEPVEA